MATGINNALSVVKTGIAVVTGVASVSAAIPTTSGNTLPYYISLSATQATYVKVGKGAQIAVPGDLLIQPGLPMVILCCGPNIDQIAAIQVTTAGILQVSPLENQ